MTYQNIKYSVSDDGFIYTLSMNRPKKMNAVTFEMTQEIAHFVHNVVNSYESKARVVIFTGEGKHFTAGLDLTAAMDLTN